MPELERLMLHKLAELDAMVRRAVDTHDWTGVYPVAHQFCNTDLSAFYFDIRKDALYCDVKLDEDGRQLRQSETRRACRTVLDILHRCLTTWLAPVLPFTADEAWRARFGEAACVHLERFVTVPDDWYDKEIAEKWGVIQDKRNKALLRLEKLRMCGTIKSSLQASAVLYLDREDQSLLRPKEWEDVLIVSHVSFEPDLPAPINDDGSVDSEWIAGSRILVEIAPGAKCARCWKVLPEVGETPAHPGLCRRCCDYVE